MAYVIIALCFGLAGGLVGRIVPIADRPAPGTTRASMTGARSDLRQATAVEEVRLGAGKSARLPPRHSRPAPFDRLLRNAMRDLLLSKCPKRAILAANRSESGESRIGRRQRSVSQLDRE